MIRLKDFTPVANVVDIRAQMLSVDVNLPVKSFPELIDYATAHPGQLTYGVDARAENREAMSRSHNDLTPCRISAPLARATENLKHRLASMTATGFNNKLTWMLRDQFAVSIRV